MEFQFYPFPDRILPEVLLLKVSFVAFSVQNGRSITR